MLRSLRLAPSSCFVRHHKQGMCLAPRAFHRCPAAWSSAGDSTATAPLAAAMIIGDEILTGSVTDTNTPWLARLLYSQGVDLVRVEHIPDDKSDIIATVTRLKQRVGQAGFVFSSGGIGPTHDDVTYESLAEAFGARLEVHESTRMRMEENYAKRGIDINAARLRMATLPTPRHLCERWSRCIAQVLVTPDLWVPLVNLQNVYILPGIPRLFRSMLEAHKGRFTGPAAKAVSLFSDWGEGDLAGPLTEIVSAHPKVTIGSYPNTHENAELKYSVKIQLQSRDGEALEAAAAAVQKATGAVPQPS